MQLVNAKYTMMFPVVSSMDHLTEDDRRYLTKVCDRDARGLVTEDAPLVATYAQGWFVWITSDDYQSNQEAIDELPLSDKAKKVFHWLYDELISSPDLPIAIRFDEAAPKIIFKKEVKRAQR